MNANRTFRPRRPYPVTVVLFSLGYITYFLSKGVFVLLATPLLLVLSPFPNARYQVFQASLRGFLAVFVRRWLPALSVYRIAEVSGLERVLAVDAAVLAANHRSFMDTLFLLSLVPRLGVVIKSRDTRQVTYRILMRVFDMVSIDAARLSSVANARDACTRILSARRRLLIYPEGTRARSGRLQAFHPLAFELACKAGVPVVPVIVHSTVPFMSKIPGSAFPRDRNEFCIRFLELESPRPGDTAETLADRVRRRMVGELKSLDAGTAWEISNQ